MDNHPIPQDVTGFKFKLIGSVTVKQFGYLLVASVICYILYALPGNFLIRLPFMLIIALIGIGLAFVPIDGRPMDLMLWYLIKAIPQDNQYIYRKSGIALPIMQVLHFPIYKKSQSNKNQKPEDEEEKKEELKIRKKAPFMPQSRVPNLPLEPHEENFLASIKNIFASSSIAPQDEEIEKKPITATYSQAQKPQPKPKVKKEAISKKDFLTKNLPSPAVVPQSGIEKQQAKTLTDEQIQGQYLELAKQQVTTQIPTVITNTSRARFLTPDDSVKAGFPLLPDIPNIMLGIIKDPRGKVLPNTLVEVYDKNNIPVRAFKTNQLGQFISATPLPSGPYTIRLEDPMKKNEFDTIRIELKGDICQPIEITSIDEREKLRQELFER